MSTQVGASVPPAGVTPNFDQPQDVLYTINFLVEILCIALVVTFVSLRVYVRACMMRQIEKEDCKYLPHFNREYRLNDFRGVCCRRGIFSKWHNLCLYANTSQILAAIYFVSGIFSEYRRDQGASRADFT
jgi:hypothetical protein